LKTIEAHLGQYAAYHRDLRNIQTHFVGVPLIVLAVTVLLSRPVLVVAGMPLSPAILAVVAASIYYLRLDLRLGAAMALLLTLAAWAGAWCAQQPTATWLALGVGGFVVGWAFQFVGHFWEGRKPAFVDDIMGLLIGPLFVLAEAGFLIGLRDELRASIEARAGATHRGRPAAPGTEIHTG
jgi:uncharacterized membrane protein YGL010W